MLLFSLILKDLHAHLHSLDICREQRERQKNNVQTAIKNKDFLFKKPKKLNILSIVLFPLREISNAPYNMVYNDLEFFSCTNQKKKKEVFFFENNTNQNCTPPHLQEEARESLGKKHLCFPFGLMWLQCLCPSHASDSEKVRIHPVSLFQTISSSLQSPRRVWPRFCLFLLSSLPVPSEHLLPQANFLSLIISLSCAKTILLLSGLLLPLISPLWTYCLSLSFLPDPHFSFPVDPPGWFLPYPSIPSGILRIIDARPNSLIQIFPLVRVGEGTGRRSAAFPNVVLLGIFPLLCLSKI